VTTWHGPGDTLDAMLARADKAFTSRRRDAPDLHGLEAAYGAARAKAACQPILYAITVLVVRIAHAHPKGASHA
jgi:adenylate kinase